MKSGGNGAAFAVQKTGEEQAEAFAALDDDYMKARAADIRDITDRLLRILAGEKELLSLDEPCIVVADDLTPTETAAMDRSKIVNGRLKK